jgi:TonB family protein
MYANTAPRATYLLIALAVPATLSADPVIDVGRAEVLRELASGDPEQYEAVSHVISAFGSLDVPAASLSARRVASVSDLNFYQIDFAGFPPKVFVSFDLGHTRYAFLALADIDGNRYIPVAFPLEDYQSFRADVREGNNLLLLLPSTDEDATSGFREPLPIVRVEPMWPSAARSPCKGGWVSVEFVVTKTGEAADVHAMDYSDDIFVEAAVNAVRKWKYKPPIVNGEPVAISGVVTKLIFECGG